MLLFTIFIIYITSLVVITPLYVYRLGAQKIQVFTVLKLALYPFFSPRKLYNYLVATVEESIFTPEIIANRNIVISKTFSNGTKEAIYSNWVLSWETIEKDFKGFGTEHIVLSIFKANYSSAKGDLCYKGTIKTEKELDTILSTLIY